MKSDSVQKLLLNGGYYECWHQKSPSKHEMNDAQKVGVIESCKYSLNNKLVWLETEILKLCPLPTQPQSDQLTTVDISVFRKKEKYRVIFITVRWSRNGPVWRYPIRWHLGLSVPNCSKSLNYDKNRSGQNKTDQDRPRRTKTDQDGPRWTKTD